jgi:hypothetical protein
MRRLLVLSIGSRSFAVFGRPVPSHASVHSYVDSPPPMYVEADLKLVESDWDCWMPRQALEAKRREHAEHGAARRISRCERSATKTPESGQLSFLFQSLPLLQLQLNTGLEKLRIAVEVETIKAPVAILELKAHAVCQVPV